MEQEEERTVDGEVNSEKDWEITNSDRLDAYIKDEAE